MGRSISCCTECDDDYYTDCLDDEGRCDPCSEIHNEKEAPVAEGFDYVYIVTRMSEDCEDHEIIGVAYTDEAAQELIAEAREGDTEPGFYCFDQWEVKR